MAGGACAMRSVALLRRLSSRSSESSARVLCAVVRVKPVCGADTGAYDGRDSITGGLVRSPSESRARSVGTISMSSTPRQVVVIEPSGMMPAVSLNVWDRAGILVSATCTVHCLLLPTLIAAAPILSLGRLLSEPVELAFLVCTAMIGAGAHIRAFVRDHRHVAPGLIFSAGFSLIVSARVFFEGHQPAPYAVGLGGLLAAASHYANVRLCRCCQDCHISARSRRG